MYVRHIWASTTVDLCYEFHNNYSTQNPFTNTIDRLMHKDLLLGVLLVRRGILWTSHGFNEISTDTMIYTHYHVNLSFKLVEIYNKKKYVDEQVSCKRLYLLHKKVLCLKHFTERIITLTVHCPILRSIPGKLVQKNHGSYQTRWYCPISYTNLITKSEWTSNVLHSHGM